VTEVGSRAETLAEQKAPDAERRRARSGRRVMPWVGFVAILATAIISSNAFAVRDHLFGTATPRAAAPALGRSATPTPGGSVPNTLPAQPTSLRSQPWWQDVTTLDGTGTATTAPFSINPDAIQYRVTWTCQAGRIQIRAPKQAKPVVDASCPNGDDGYVTQSGSQTLQISADGPWHLAIAQQIDTPLVEPLLPGMTAPGASVVSSGTFYNIDKTSMGKVTLYRQADGTYALRLDDFFVSPTSDLELRFSTLASPHTSAEVENASSALVSIMDVTAGSLNYTVPAGVDPSKYGSVVIWCRPISSAYAAAVLK
jgi:hypothetical protein